MPHIAGVVGIVLILLPLIITIVLIVSIIQCSTYLKKIYKLLPPNLKNMDKRLSNLEYSLDKIKSSLVNLKASEPKKEIIYCNFCKTKLDVTGVEATEFPCPNCGKMISIF